MKRFVETIMIPIALIIGTSFLVYSVMYRHEEIMVYSSAFLKGLLILNILLSIGYGINDILVVKTSNNILDICEAKNRLIYFVKKFFQISILLLLITWFF